ncbi:hypothetical protein SAMN04487866_1228 [Thermoactinomyces sp. DSM 45891]|uniref:hypothetical protein n=1 Tax=Thermoactinomyces sp. DSM 45891 TaxID=1761907 RepID=UPI0009152697|nr:hypothetical protein [Thermoactinomyces sp. DSM 45891]SFX74614.1 hypothetical protein SAMN04487866_1228 [Thermoactinomyces sp. DSM 45891]
MSKKDYTRISYRLTPKANKLLSTYTAKMQTTRSKLVSFILYDALIKNEISVNKLREIMETMKSRDLLPDNLPLHTANSTFDAIEKARKNVPEFTSYRNEFLGWLLSYHIELLPQKLKKKTGEALTQDDFIPEQTAFFLNPKLKKKMGKYIKKYRLTVQFLVFDILFNEHFSSTEFLANITISKEEKKARYLTMLPKFLYKEVKNSPISISFLIEVSAENYLKKYKHLA